MIGTLIGFRYADRRGAYFRWGEFSRGWGIALELCLFGDDEPAGGHWSLMLQFIYGRLYLRLPLPGREPRGDMLEAWGFSWRWDRQDNSSIHLHWGARSKILHLPWHPTWFRTSYLLVDGVTWAHELRRPRRQPLVHITMAGADFCAGFQYFRDLPKWSASYPYMYVLRSGVVQRVTATVKVEEREWRLRWLMGLAWPAVVQRSIAVEFSAEVGERSGSWKGGTIGCGYTLRHDETPEGCLRRMEVERTF